MQIILLNTEKILKGNVHSWKKKGKMSATEKDTTEAEKGTSVEKERGIVLMCKTTIKKMRKKEQNVTFKHDKQSSNLKWLWINKSSLFKEKGNFVSSCT